MQDHYQLESIIRSLPKTEVHLHLEGLIDEAAYAQLSKDRGDKTIIYPQRPIHNLSSFIEQFCLLQDSIDRPQKLNYLLDRLGIYLEQNNVIYAEVFFSPNRLMDKGLALSEMLEVLTRGIRTLEQNTGRTVRLLIDVSRSFGPAKAMRTLQQVLEYRTPEIIGIGLGGIEKEGEDPQYASVFELARTSGLVTVAHAGEDNGPGSVWDALDILRVDRIGHATSAVQDPALIRTLKSRNTPVEICMTSNLLTGKYVSRIEDHPVRALYDAGVPVSINSDDPAIFQTDITREYCLLVENLGFSLHEVLGLMTRAVDYTFASRKILIRQTVEDGGRVLREKQPLLFL